MDLRRQGFLGARWSAGIVCAWPELTLPPEWIQPIKIEQPVPRDCGLVTRLEPLDVVLARVEISGMREQIAEAVVIDMSPACAAGWLDWLDWRNIRGLGPVIPGHDLHPRGAGCDRGFPLGRHVGKPAGFERAIVGARRQPAIIRRDRRHEYFAAGLECPAERFGGLRDQVRRTRRAEVEVTVRTAKTLGDLSGFTRGDLALARG